MSAESFEAPSLELLASLLPAYEFEAFIAQGGMGAVYQARQRSLDRDVAIKILPREIGADPEFRKSFETEAKAMARLNHPNLIGVYDFGDVDGMPYIVMELVDGGSLFESAYNLAVDAMQAVTIVKGICDGLAHAHENGVIHRDIKPANILLNQKAEPKIGDFGLARPAGADSSGILMGTPGYVAPEVLHHPDHADCRSDLFALGVVLYELLIGRCPPYEGYLPPPSTVCGCDPALDRICEKAMHPSADQRYPSAEAMSAALGDWLKRGKTSPTATPVAPAWRPVVHAPNVRRPAPAVQYRDEDSGSSGLIKVLLAAAALITIGAIGWSKFNKPPASQETVDQTSRKPVIESPKPATREPVTRETEKPKETGSTEKPLDSLARLKADLAAGLRTEMPQGSFALGDSDLMVVPTPMTWQDAANFAESHGAHLFVPTTDQDIGRLPPLIPAEKSGLWIGVGRSGAAEWLPVDGSGWKPAAKPEGEGIYGIVDSKGVLQARDSRILYPFVLQWRRDGSNPGTLEAVIERTGESIDSGKPVYPPGTVEHEDRHVFIAAHASSQPEAQALARQAGGHLAVPATVERDAWLTEQLAGLTGDQGYWIGATRDGDAWKWCNGEPWDHASWKVDPATVDGGNFVKVIPGVGWQPASSSEQASGFIIEWGGPAVAIPEDKANLPPAIAELEEKAKGLVAGLEKERQKELAANAKAFAWDLDTWLKDLGKNENLSWRRDVTLFKNAVTDNRVPDKVEGLRLSEPMSRIAARTIQKQKLIDLSFETKAAKIRDAYVTRVKDAISTFEKSGDAKAVKLLSSRVAKAVELKSWLESLAPGGPQKQANARDPFVGRWVWMSKQIIVVRPDGSLFNEVNKNTGTWEFTPRVEGGSQSDFIGTERVYRLSWNKGELIDTMTLFEGADDIEGTNQNGDKIAGERISKGSDPIVGAWFWGQDKSLCNFRADQKVTKRGDKGQWSLVSDEEGNRTYKIEWTSGYRDEFAIGKDPDAFEGKNNGGLRIWANRAEG